ncbi:MAG: undecaprenyl-phosphate alpha-N-acetylglucosaminyl 1-phosphate transferase [Chthonomonadaceae bacterium]|nr:undecaprenyl-phosphate alpha-N-acetylglucosaminyl 1-phosphate transferase [Chthonomonadaceae bacterium]
MQPTPSHCAVLWLFTLMISTALTQLVIVAAHKFKLIAKPKADRWHQTPTALFGGVAIVTAFLLVSGCVLARYMPPRSYELVGLFVGGIFLFALGVRDDAIPLNPLVKLLGQVMSVTPFLIGMGLAHNSPLYVFAMPAVLLWMVALTNAFNLLDNMNGLSAGTAAAVSGVLSLYAFEHGDLLIGLFSALLSACCLGFLYFNCRFATPARIFMGDCGSMFLGYMLAGLTILGVVRPQSAPLASLTIPFLLMTLPIFDTLLVIVRRKQEGRAISQGGKDHSSHRLVYSGLSQKQAVFALYTVSVLCGGIALLCERLNHPVLLPMLVAGVAVSLWYFGVYLSRFPSPRPTKATPPLREASLDTTPLREANLDAKTT